MVLGRWAVDGVTDCIASDIVIAVYATDRRRRGMIAPEKWSSDPWMIRHNEVPNSADDTCLVRQSLRVDGHAAYSAHCTCTPFR